MNSVQEPIQQKEPHLQLQSFLICMKEESEQWQQRTTVS